MSDSDAEVERELSAFTEGKPKHSIEANEVLDFGWAEDKPLTGRRATKEKIKKIIKPGSFGELKNVWGSWYNKDACMSKQQYSFRITNAPICHAAESTS